MPTPVTTRVASSDPNPFARPALTARGAQDGAGSHCRPTGLPRRRRHRRLRSRGRFGEFVAPFPALAGRPAPAGSAGDPLAGRGGMPGEPSGLGRAAPQDVGPDVEVVAPASLRSAGEVDGVADPRDFPESRVVVLRLRSIGRDIATGLLGPSHEWAISDHRILRAGRPTGGAAPPAGAGRGRRSAGRPLTLGRAVARRSASSSSCRSATPTPCEALREAIWRSVLPGLRGRWTPADQARTRKRK